MRTCAKCSGIILNKMQSTSKQALIDMLRFVESQTAFIIKTTVRISNYQDFSIQTMAWYYSIRRVCACKLLVKRSDK